MSISMHLVTKAYSMYYFIHVDDIYTAATRDSVFTLYVDHKSKQPSVKNCSCLLLCNNYGSYDIS